MSNRLFKFKIGNDDIKKKLKNYIDCIYFIEHYCVISGDDKPIKLKDYQKYLIKNLVCIYDINKNQ